MIYENKAKKEFKENKKTMAMTQSGVTHIRVQSLVLLSRSSFNAMPKARTLLGLRTIEAGAITSCNILLHMYQVPVEGFIPFK
jgi:hypothetical protein